MGMRSSFKACFMDDPHSHVNHRLYSSQVSGDCEETAFVVTDHF